MKELRDFGLQITLAVESPFKCCHLFRPVSPIEPRDGSSPNQNNTTPCVLGVSKDVKLALCSTQPYEHFSEPC